MISELSRRKPNFEQRNSAPIVLAGATWYLPKPWLEIRPVFRAGVARTAAAVLTYGPEIDELVDAIAESEALKSQVIGAASLAAHLLRWHYDLSDEDLDGLLWFRAADPTSLEWVSQVIDVATGESGPKVSSAGDD